MLVNNLKQCDLICEIFYCDFSLCIMCNTVVHVSVLVLAAILSPLCQNKTIGSVDGEILVWRRADKGR